MTNDPPDPIEPGRDHASETSEQYRARVERALAPPRAVDDLVAIAKGPRSGLHDGQDRDANGEALPGTEAPDDVVVSRARLEVLERNGYSAVREAAIKPLQALAGLPVDALDEALMFARRHHAAVKLAGDRDRVRDARRTLRYLEAAARIGRELRALEGRIVAGEVVA